MHISCTVAVYIAFAFQNRKFKVCDTQSTAKKKTVFHTFCSIMCTLIINISEYPSPPPWVLECTQEVTFSKRS